MSHYVGPWVEIDNYEALEAALAQARGSYQRDLLRGIENLSGSSLRGKAKSYGDRYARSRRNLLNRLSKAGVPHSERIGHHGRRILVVG